MGGRGRGELWMVVGLLLLVGCGGGGGGGNGGGGPVISAFTASPNSGTVPFQVTFTWQASDPDGDPLTVSLNFGDGSAPATSLPDAGSTQHTYQAAGNYTARLTVTAGGDTTDRTASIQANPPVTRSRKASGRFTERLIRGGGSRMVAAIHRAIARRQQPQLDLQAFSNTHFVDRTTAEVVAIPGQGTDFSVSAIDAQGRFEVSLRLNVNYGFAIRDQGRIKDYLLAPDGTPLNLTVTAEGDTIDLGEVRPEGDRIIASRDPRTAPGVQSSGDRPPGYQQWESEQVTEQYELLPTGIEASELYQTALFQAVDSDYEIMGTGMAPDGLLTLVFPSQAFKDRVDNFLTFDTNFMVDDLTQLPANTPTYAIQYPYFVGGGGRQATIDDGIWGLVSGTVHNAYGSPIKDALVAFFAETPNGVGYVLNFGRTDAYGQFQFYLERNLVAEDIPEGMLEYSLFAASTLDPDALEIFYQNGEPVAFTPEPGYATWNQWTLTFSNGRAMRAAQSGR